MGAAKGGERLAKTARGQQAFGEVGGVDEDDVGIAGETAVLESVVEQVNGARGGGEALFGEQAGGVATGSEGDGKLGAARDEEGFVAVAAGVTGGIHQFDGTGVAAVAAGEHIDRDVLSGEEFGEADDEGCLAGAADGEVADAEDGPAQDLRAKPAAGVGEVFGGDGSTIDRDEREQPAAAHAEPRSRKLQERLQRAVGGA